MVRGQCIKNLSITLSNIVGVVGTRSMGGAEVDGIGSDEEVEIPLGALILSKLSDEVCENKSYCL